VNALVWFRSDLRIDDNPALAAAVRAADATAAVFFLCPEQWRDHDWGAPKVDFLLRNLGALADALAELGIPLVLEEAPRFEEVPDRLLTLARRLECEALFFNREYEVNERRRDRAVERLLGDQGIEVESFEDQTILPPDAIETTQGSFYTVFTPFRRAWTKRLEETGLPEPQDPPSSASGVDVDSSPVPTSVEGFGEFDGAELWPAGEAEAAQRLETFLEERASTYAKQRDIPAEPGTSQLSPYLTLGVLSIRRCLAAAVAANKGSLADGKKGLDVWISELVWREFYRHVLVGYPRVSKHRAFKLETEKIEWRDSDSDFEAWAAGRTGVPIVDAGMRQLEATGWMHNRVRMITAMFLSKDLFLDWRRGEQHFMRHLVDGDLASNNGGWQWSASTGTDAAPYFRIFNPWTQGKRYDPEGRYIRRWVPELAEVPAEKLHDPKKLSPIERAELDYPEPIVDHKSARIRAIEAFREAG
jgi:deoxyribodipyrimidine photo-lyase